MLRAALTNVTTFPAAAALAIFAAGCGARTGLDPCVGVAAERPCETACGEGTQTCMNGSWTACDVPSAERACTNPCGEGSQTCNGGVWSDCAVPDAERSCPASCGAGMQTCTRGAWGPCEGPEAGAPSIQAQLWDFRAMTPPDFGGSIARSVVGVDRGIVAPNLGPDGTPVYAGDPTTPTTHGALDFQDWYHTTGVNLTTRITLPFAPSVRDPTIFASENPSLFPVDNQLFGNETPSMGAPVHNYYFTIAFSLPFRYRGGETFRLASDDDSWMFVNQTLAINLGGLHEELGGTVNLDAMSAALGITVGGEYVMDVFYADRQPISAVLDLEVPAADFAVCPDGGLP